MRLFYSFSSMLIIAAAAFACVDWLPAAGVINEAPYWLLAAFEGLLIMQLIAAWNRHYESLPLAHLVMLPAIFFLRMVFRLLGDSGVLWALRAGSAHTVDLGWIGYVGLCALHPAAYKALQRFSRGCAARPAALRAGLFAGFLALFTLACFVFRSYHITRDGFDWIERTTQPVWHLYMREPLTIGLYRWIFLLVWERWEITSFQVIGMTSIAAGVWWAVWMGLLIGRKWADGFDRLLAWLLLASSGGLMVLFFAHIEVYPIFIAGLAPALYYARRCLEGKSGIFPAASWFSVAFLLHLSAAWLLAAFLLLPLLKKERGDWKRECLIFIGIFGLIQSAFWGYLIVTHYGGSLDRFWARMNETFFVGPDRAMFLPPWVWLHPGHWLDLANAYLYYSIPAVLLAPLAFWRILPRRGRETAFWLAAAGGYFLYTFFWNPDRGYPEDWDLFSPFTPLLVLTILHLLLPGADESSDQSSEKAEYRRSLVYLAAVGCFVFSCSQIYYHHIIPFVPPQYR